MADLTSPISASIGRTTFFGFDKFKLGILPCPTSFDSKLDIFGKQRERASEVCALSSTSLLLARMPRIGDVRKDMLFFSLFENAILFAMTNRLGQSLSSQAVYGYERQIGEITAVSRPTFTGTTNWDCDSGHLDRCRLHT